MWSMHDVYEKDVLISQWSPVLLQLEVSRKRHDHLKRSVLQSTATAMRPECPGVEPEGPELRHEALPRHGGGAGDVAQGCAKSTHE